MANVDSLCLEITRRCNMACEHCLRGEAEKDGMSLETAMRAIRKFDNIGSIVFGGGEPTLEEDLIEDIVDFIIRENIDLDGFYMATNGKQVSMKTMFALSKLYAYIIEKNGAFDDYQCVVDISRDQFHEDVRKNIPILKAFRFVNERGEIPELGIINDGYAQKNGIGRRDLDKTKSFYKDQDYDGENRYEMVYVNAYGLLYPDCDLSYNSQRNLPAVSIVSTKSFDDLVEEYELELNNY